MTLCFNLKTHLSFSTKSVNTVSKFWFLFFFFFSVLCFSHVIAANEVTFTKLGVIVDISSRIGKEEKTAMEIAVESFNNVSDRRNKLSLYIQDKKTDPFQAALMAEDMIKDKGVEVIIGTETWEESVLVANIGSRNRVPIISFAAPAVTPPMMPVRWPFLVQMANNDYEQMRCIAAIVHSYNWRQVVAIYEDDTFGGDSSGKSSLLAEALRDIGSDIEFSLVLPPFSSLSNPKEVVQQELTKLDTLGVQSRVFVVLRSSFSMTVHLFREAKSKGFVGRDSVWIITEKITSFIDSFNTSVISSMQGVLGIKPYFSEQTSSYKEFRSKFRKKIRSEYQDEDNFEPGLYALRSYDAIKLITDSLERIQSSDERNHSRNLLTNILASKFSGLSGEISFEENRLSHDPTLKIVNIVGKKYKDLDVWLPNRGLLNNGSGNVFNAWVGKVMWPGDLERSPKGWAMPSAKKPLLIGVPGRTSFEKFVKVNLPNEYHGFCIDLFKMVLPLLGYDLPYEFKPYYGTYDELIELVYNKTFDAVVGDMTILAERAEMVEFTQPFAESGLSMIVPAKPDDSAWMFMKPFTWEMWIVTGAILIYTMFIVWFLEHQCNPEFDGPLLSQIGTALWFTFSSLFSAQRENIYNKFTRVVVLVWLFLALVLTSSYTASLSSMLTVHKLKPNVTDIEFLKRSNLKVGCDGDSFVKNYLKNVLNIKKENIMNVSSQYDYPEEFAKNRIAAAFLELPYKKVFIDSYCKNYTATAPTYRFGGLGFAFQKGSPMAMDFSKAILKLSENGHLRELEKTWFASNPECSSNVTDDSTESLKLDNFWGLYLISGAISTLCFLLFLVQLLYNYRRRQKEHAGNTSLLNDDDNKKRSVWNKTVRLARYIYKGEEVITVVASNLGQVSDRDGWSSLTRDYSNPSITTSENHEASSERDIEMPNVPGC